MEEESKDSGLFKGIVIGAGVTLVIIAIVFFVYREVLLPGNNSNGGESTVVDNDDTPTPTPEGSTTPEKENENEPETEPESGTEEKSNDFEKISVNNLSVKLAKLNFNHQSEAVCSEGGNAKDAINGRIEIVDGKVELTVNDKKTTISNVKNPRSVGCGVSVQGSGSFESYILTSEGEVFKVEEGSASNMNIVKAEAISVVDRDFNLSDNAQTTNPTVYIKTTDGRIYTDEFSKTLVEVVEK